MDDNIYLIYKKYINVIISCDCFSCLELESVILMEKEKTASIYQRMIFTSRKVRVS